ncbi:ferroxidase [Blattabacterium sp. (Blattella germanica) str. Bge]|uniref:ferritin n=1 Tax=Blattabacterium sp. (Blattella germanica) TaxID=624186 RepID=UPI0001BB611F|nr:ferritin [Blattabacterium sp. (Blattella germanica)]ACY40233.1 ferroxidase [Blattabacterium sp. (Blattella germanica) str. Bge]
MLSEKIQIGLIKQLNRESESSQLYLSMASWVEKKGFEGICEFLYDHSHEERMHMLKLIRYINKRGGVVVLDNIFIRKITYKSLKELFQTLFKHEKEISNEINLLLELSLQEKDYFTYNFLQWYVEEQIEEETLSKMILDKIELIGEDKGGLYLFDKDIKNFHKK